MARGWSRSTSTSPAIRRLTRAMKVNLVISCASILDEFVNYQDCEVWSPGPDIQDYAGGMIGPVMLYYGHLEDKRDSSDVEKDECGDTEDVYGRVPE